MSRFIPDPPPEQHTEKYDPKTDSTTTEEHTSSGDLERHQYGDDSKEFHPTPPAEPPPSKN